MMARITQPISIREIAERIFVLRPPGRNDTCSNAKCAHKPSMKLGVIWLCPDCWTLACKVFERAQATRQEPQYGSD